METTRVDARITLREATPADAPRLAYWDEQPHVIECDPNYLPLLQTFFTP